jgi:hypothetical protein
MAREIVLDVGVWGRIWADGRGARAGGPALTNSDCDLVLVHVFEFCFVSWKKKLFVITCHTPKAVRSVEGRLQLQRFVGLSTANLCSSILLAARSRLKAQSLQFRQGCTLLKRKIFT